MILKILILEDFEQSGIFESWSKTLSFDCCVCPDWGCGGYLSKVMATLVFLLVIFGVLEIGHHWFSSDFLQHYKEKCTETLILVDTVSSY